MADLPGATMLCIHLDSRRGDSAAMSARVQAQLRHAASVSGGTNAVSRASVSQQRRGLEGVMTRGSVQGHASPGADLGQRVQGFCAHVAQTLEGLLRRVFEEDRSLAH